MFLPQRLGHPLLPILSTCCRGAMSSSGTPAGLSPGEIDDRLLNTVDDSTTHPGEALRLIFPLRFSYKWWMSKGLFAL